MYLCFFFLGVQSKNVIIKYHIKPSDLNLNSHLYFTCGVYFIFF